MSMATWMSSIMVGTLSPVPEIPPSTAPVGMVVESRADPAGKLIEGCAYVSTQMGGRTVAGRDITTVTVFLLLNFL